MLYIFKIAFGKMKPIKTILLICALLISNNLNAQIFEKPFGLSVNYSYTTTSKLFLQTKTLDPVIRNLHEDIDDVYSYSAELRYRFYEPLIIALKIESLTKTYSSKINLGGTLIPMEEGYKTMPLELSILYELPFSSKQFLFFMGGGIGIYSGQHIRKIRNVESSSDEQKITFGVHVQFGMDYVVYDFLSIRGEMLFRDPEFEMASSYSADTVEYMNNTYLITTPSFTSKVNIDGVTFSIGAVINF